MLAVSTFSIVLALVVFVVVGIVRRFAGSRRGFYAELAQSTSQLAQIQQWIQTYVRLNPNGSEMSCWHLWLGHEAAANGAADQAQQKINEVMAECEQVGARRNPAFGSTHVDELRLMASDYVFNK
jgi:hypothetical protein